MKLLFFVTLLCASILANSQETLKGVVVDSISRQPLPFATVQTDNGQQTIISGIDGRFFISLKLPQSLLFSYSGHTAKTILSSAIKSSDTVFLAPSINTLEAVVIRPQQDKISRIINAVIEAKPLNNPDRYGRYECRVYYKMIVDIKPFGNYNMDSIRHRQDSVRSARTSKKKPKASAAKDTARSQLPFTLPSHLFMTETYSKRLYKRPAQVQELVVASKVSGISKTYFANVVTDVLPFHVYSDYIPLNGIDFSNPIAKGWQSRYRFLLENEIVTGHDTLYILRYKARRGISFNSLEGLVYITTAGYAVTHFTGASNAADSANRFVKFEHIYSRVDGKWFPQELNYTFGIRRMPAPYTQLVWSGHSQIDSVSFVPTTLQKFDKAHPLKFGDSVDLHTDVDWRHFRRDTLSLEERNTYKNIDSLMKATPMKSFVLFSLRLATGRIPVGPLDVDISRLAAANQYEGTRLGLGLYTNNKVSKYYSVGGWFGYGFTDKASKYGGSFTLFPKGDKETSLSFSFQKNYRLTGSATVHPEVSESVLQNWLLQQIDEVKEYTIAANIKPGYWELRPSFTRTETGPLHYYFQLDGKPVTAFTAQEAGIGLRYAYAEKRVPFFDYYLPTGTRYPVAYANVSYGEMQAGERRTRYYRALAAVTFTKHINRWGADRFKLEAGVIHSTGNGPLPRSLLLAANGFRRSGINFYSWGGFMTLHPFDFYSDRYVQLFYKHDLDKNFWSLRWSKPYLSLAHNIVYGSLQAVNESANNGLQSFSKGYHESGLVFNRLLRFNIGFADAGLNAGMYHHWSSGNWQDNSVWVIGLSAGF